MTEPAGDLLELARQVAARARAGEELEVYASHIRETDVAVFERAVESITVAERSGVGVRAVVDGCQGFAWAGSLDPDVVDQALAEARDNARFSGADEYQGVARPDEVVAGTPMELDLWHDTLAEVPVDDKVALALELDAATASLDPAVRGVEMTTYGDAMIEVAVANSLGVDAASARTSCSCTTIALAGEGSETRTGYGFSAGRSFETLDPAAAARDAVERAVRLLGARRTRSRRLPVLLDPLVTRSVIGIVAAALSGEAALTGRSLFVGREGEAVGAPGVTLVDDPTNPEAFGASPHDAEGVPTRANPLIVDGVLRGFLHNTYTGRRTGTGTTGSAVRGFSSTPGVGPRAIALAPGARSPEELLALAGEALYVQSVSGLHSGTNPVSGDFSVGAEGLMVRDGAFAEPVREVTIASTLGRMLAEVVEVGADLTWLPGAAAGVTVLIGEMSLSG